jgi:hypothetical protein
MDRVSKRDGFVAKSLKQSFDGSCDDFTAPVR